MEDTQVVADAHLLSRNLGQFPDPEAKPTLIVVSGLPGTGKTYFGSKLAERLPFVILESDTLRKMLFPSPTYTPAESARLFQAIHRLIEELLKRGTSLILDATNLSERYRERLYNIAERLDVKLILVRVEAPADLVRERLKARTEGKQPESKSDADWAVYQKLQPAIQEIRRNHYAVDIYRDITPVIDKIARDANK